MGTVMGSERTVTYSTRCLTRDGVPQPKTKAMGISLVSISSRATQKLFK